MGASLTRNKTMTYTRPNNISTDPDNLTWAQIAKIVQEMFQAGCTYHNKAKLEQYAKEHGLSFKDKALVAIMLDRYIAWLNR